MEWVYLGLAIVFEGAGTTMMKLSNGGERILESVLVGAFYLICFGFLTLALKGMPISIAYALWSGFGIMIAVAVGYFLFDEPITVLKALAIILIVGGVALLNYSSHCTRRWSRLLSKSNGLGHRIIIWCFWISQLQLCITSITNEIR